MIEIKLTQGKTALIDDSDYGLVKHYRWYAIKQRNTYYAVCTYNGRHIRMHRFILGLIKGELVDHKDRNGLNNQRANLRRCNYSQNNSNRLAWGKSKYLGVSAYGDKFRAAVCKDSKKYGAGTYVNEIDAARAYDKLAKELHGEYANLNFK